ncbi:MAG: DNA-directed DNA polymerase, partial [Candidatus Micrarchaeota archaeon]|nr:DNA-directed DNA polymerase [Candidatus Micrarchaeota archaeon]
CTYNGDQFDLPCLQERIFKTGAKAHLGRDGSTVKTKRLGIRTVSKLGGRIHYDVYSTVAFLNYIGAIKLPRMTLEHAYEGLLGKTKVDFPKDKIVSAWDQGGKALDDLVEYSRQDAVACQELAHYSLPLFVALGRVTGTTLFDVSRFASGQLVEALLMRKAFEREEIVPNKPSAAEVAARTAEPIQGAFVKLPKPGVYENMAVFDFKSLYPSIIISHNIDPSTLNCDCCSDPHVAPGGQRFCKKRKGLIPQMLNEVLDQRFAIQAEMKAHEKGSEAYNQLHAQQWALKILANSTYGVLLYPRFRWFRRECGESVTAFGREYIQKAIAEAENAGFDTLYGDSLTRDRFVTIQDENGQV